MRLVIVRLRHASCSCCSATQAVGGVVEPKEYRDNGDIRLLRQRVPQATKQSWQTPVEGRGRTLYRGATGNRCRNTTACSHLLRPVLGSVSSVAHPSAASQTATQFPAFFNSLTAAAAAAIHPDYGACHALRALPLHSSAAPVSIASSSDHFYSA